MSDRRCDECTSRYSLRTYAPCSRCDGVPGHPEWLPNEQHALRIRAEQAEARVQELERQRNDAYSALEWLRLNGVRVGDLRCEPDTRPDDMYAEDWCDCDAQEPDEWRERLGIALQWPPCEDQRWYASALEWIRQQGIAVSGGVVVSYNWAYSRPQTGTEFYSHLSAAVGAQVGPRKGEQW